MPSIDDVYAGASLKAADLNGKSYALTIARVDFKDFDDGPKLAISFRGTDKVLICNKTNANRIAEHHGRNYEAWPGKQIRIYPDRTEFQGRLVDCIRVELPQHGGPAQAPLERPASTYNARQSQEQPPAEAPAGGWANDLDDAIPFEMSWK